jgi:hypothetical protein
MLEIRPICENCSKALPNDSNEAMICTFECTYCRDCVEKVLFNVCPNCGGGLEKRPTRPSRLLEKNPPQTEELLKPVEPEKFALLLEKYRNIDPRQR